MKIIVLITVFCSSLCMAQQQLGKLSLDDIGTLGLTLENDYIVKVEGKASLKITSKWSTSVCLGEIDGIVAENCKLVYQAQVKSDIRGMAFLEMWCHFGDKSYFSRGLHSVVKGKTGWKTLQTIFWLQKGQIPDKVTLNIVLSGKGTCWIDDIKLKKVMTIEKEK